MGSADAASDAPLAAVAVALVGLSPLAACTPTTGRYISMIYAEGQTTKVANITYGSAPGLPDEGNGQMSPTRGPEARRGGPLAVS